MIQALGMLIDAATLVAATSYALSAAVALAARLGAATERRAWWNVVLPPLGGLAVVAMGFGSALWDAWMVTPDHCGDQATHEPYLCWLHPAGTVGLAPLETLAVAVLLVALLLTAMRLAQWARAAWRISVMVDAASPREATKFRGVLAEVGVPWRGPITVVRSDEPICCVTGWRNPRLLVSTAIAERLRPTEIGVMVEHERAHIQRRDPLRRLVAHLARVAHLPGLGKRAVDAWTLAAEVECDRAAAQACGSRVQVAETLVRFRRAFDQRPDPQLARAVSAFAGAGELETRVRTLLARTPEAPAPSPPRRWLALAVAVALAPAVHPALETLLRLLHA